MDAPFTRPYVDRPCWSCHWFGYLMAENWGGVGRCTNPSLSAAAAQPNRGCAFWREGPAGSMEPLAPSDPERRRADRERARLVRILEQGERARLPYGAYVRVIDRSGLLELDLADHLESRRDELTAVVERLGVNNAIRAGRL